MDYYKITINITPFEEWLRDVLVEQLGGEIVQLNFLMELSFLNGREKIKGYDVFAAMTY